MFYKKAECFNRGDNWAVVTPIYKNWIPSCSLSCEEFKYFLCRVCILINSLDMTVCSCVVKTNIFND